MAIEIEKTDIVYKGWLTLHKATMRDDAGERFSREIEDHGEGVAVLPYDPARKVALVVRLPRAPVLFRGETENLIEVPAGLLEKGEEPAAAARREAFEEAGVELTTMEPLGTIWTMPGISTERMHLFLAPYALSDRTASGGGLAGENENITVQEIPLADLARLADTHALTDMRTLAMLLHLRLARPDLF